MILDKIFSTKSRILVLREISKSKNGISNANLSRRTGMSQMGISKIIKELDKEDVVKTEMVGTVKLSKLNKNLAYFEDIVDLFKWEESVDKEIIAKIIYKLNKKYDSKIVILFGSRARGNEKITSDFDIMIISDKTAKKVKSEFIEGFLVSIFQLSKSEFKKRLQRKNPLILNIYNEGKILKGVKEYEKLI